MVGGVKIAENGRGAVVVIESGRGVIESGRGECKLGKMVGGRKW